MNTPPNLANLFSPIRIGACEIPNRIVSTGHHTYLADGAPSDELIAYHVARARHGVGLIVTEIVAVHDSVAFAPKLLLADAATVPRYRALVDACGAHGSRMFAQLFHPGREVQAAYSGMGPLAWAPSAVPNERFHIMPKALTRTMIAGIVRSFGESAAHLRAAGFDGFEIVASHGYLPAQFLNPRVNLRDDEYGGDRARRMQFLREVAQTIRARADGAALGLRISADDLDGQGLDADEVAEACAALAPLFDYFSVVAGTSASLAGSVHVVPPMGVGVGNDYIAPFARRIKRVAARPVIATGRINQPQDAERIIADGSADLCGMTRALICDAAMTSKARAGAFDHIRACIGCNQSCIGRAHKGLGISCIQCPESGRELAFGESGALPRAAKPRRIVVAGGGVAGMKAAAAAAQRGHAVTLFERAARLGGQSLLAMQLPGRAEFGGIVGNLEREMRAHGVAAHTGAKVDRAMIDSLRREERIDALIIATGALPYVPLMEGVSPSESMSSNEDAQQGNVLNAWQVIRGEARTGARVVVADWKGDWIGLGLAEMLATQGCRVTLCANAALAGEALQLYTRNHYLGRVKKLGVTIQTHLRLFGRDRDAVYFQDVLTEEPVVFDEVDTLVLSLGHRSDDTLERELTDCEIETHAIGDCLIPRTAEEAVYEGLQVARTI
ncbi:MAG: FAD-dependent oxidoreductase [bacterium]